jgi:3-oxoacyl-[acyl-carrier-protein] synthase III
LPPGLSAASIPIALVSFGAGLTWASVVVQWQ